MKIFIVAQKLELVCYFGQARKLHYSLTMTGALKQAFQYEKDMVSLCHRVGLLTNMLVMCVSGD